MQIVSHFSSKAFSSPSLLPSLTTAALTFRRRPPNFQFYPSSSSFPSLACHLSSGHNTHHQPSPPMDSPPPDQPSVDSVTHGLRNQSLAGGDAPRARLKLEDLNWDNSFVRELPGDPRTDTFPREVLHACFTKVTPSAEVDDPQLVVRVSC